MTRRTAVTTLAGFPALLRAQSRKPNVLFMMTDDQRFDAMSCAGNPILKTPHMDRLAEGGVRFTEAFSTNPLCSPSRGTILTGLYTHAHGVTTNAGASHHFRPGVVTYPQLLQKAGYYSAMLGKWHIATLPTGLGFDHWAILPGQGLYHNPQMIINGGRVQFRGYVDDIVADQTIETLKNRPKDKPFSLICNFKAPHRAWQPADRFAKMYDDISIPEPPLFNEGLDNRPKGIRDSDLQIADMPDFRQRGVPAEWPREMRKKANYQQYVKNYYRTLLGVDENVGRVLDHLDKEGVAENTIVIYTADNGFFMGEYGMFDKRLMYEPSVRVPMLMRYPAMVGRGRVDRDNMVLNNDVAHTVLDCCGISRPAHMEHHGLSWRPVLEEKSGNLRDSWMYEYFEYPGPHCAPMARGVRTKRWKLIDYIQQPRAHEMFDLQSDPAERTNLYDRPEHRATAKALQQQLSRWEDLTKVDRSFDNTPAPACTEGRMRPLQG